MFVPDFVRETFEEGVDHGGGDSERRSVRFLQWIVDPDPTDTTYEVDFAILLRGKAGGVRLEHDRHVLGLFSRARWMRLLREVGFKPRVVKHRDVRDAFLAFRPVEARVPRRGV